MNRSAGVRRPESAIIAITMTRQSPTRKAQLVVRNLDARIVKRLRERAAAHGRSAEAEHREILRAALLAPTEKKTFMEVLLEMPDAGDDADFERPRDLGRKVKL